MKSNLIVVDVEADGPCPSLYSMISFGAVVVDEKLDKTFYGQCKPISENWIPEALAVSGHTRPETMLFPDASDTMRNFNNWIKNLGFKPIFISDNPAFDWQFINWYFHDFVGSNPFGFSARRIGDLYCGMTKDMRAKWKHLRSTAHTHHPVDDAKGNAEALLKMKAMGLRGL